MWGSVRIGVGKCVGGGVREDVERCGRVYGVSVGKCDGV